jgi:hypothetical protein
MNEPGLSIAVAQLRTTITDLEHAVDALEQIIGDRLPYLQPKKPHSSDPGGADPTDPARLRASESRILDLPKEVSDMVARKSAAEDATAAAEPTEPAKKRASGKKKVKSAAKPTPRASSGAPVGAARARKQQQAAQRTHAARATSQGRKNQARRDKRR